MINGDAHCILLLGLAGWDRPDIISQCGGSDTTFGCHLSPCLLQYINDLAAWGLLSTGIPCMVSDSAPNLNHPTEREKLAILREQLFRKGQRLINKALCFFFGRHGIGSYSWANILLSGGGCGWVVDNARCYCEREWGDLRGFSEVRWHGSDILGVIANGSYELLTAWMAGIACG